MLSRWLPATLSITQSRTGHEITGMSSSLYEVVESSYPRSTEFDVCTSVGAVHRPPRIAKRRTGLVGLNCNTMRRRYDFESPTRACVTSLIPGSMGANYQERIEGIISGESMWRTKVLIEG